VKFRPGVNFTPLAVTGVLESLTFIQYVNVTDFFYQQTISTAILSSV